MRVFDSVSTWKAYRPELNGRIGLVPTMGALHEGHLSLVRKARQENDLVVVWVFVNPKQFNENDDFSNYPRDLNRDLAMLEAEGVDYVLAPTVDQVYPQGFQTYVNVEGLTEPLEGIHRPGHFRGVTTVVAKMLCLTQCTHAYFGQKDAQQSIVVSQMAADLDMLTKIVVCPTVREPDGLAMSSRNALLTEQDRKAAGVIYKALKDTNTALGCGERSGEVLRKRLHDFLAREPRVEVEYVSVASPKTLHEYDTVTGEVLASVAVKIGRVRLIDNFLIPLEDTPK